MNSMFFPATPRRNRDAPYATARRYTPGYDDTRSPLDLPQRAPDRHPMTRDETEFRVRPGKPRDHQPRPPRALSERFLLRRAGRAS